jgi:hypothetical protein
MYATRKNDRLLTTEAAVVRSKAGVRKRSCECTLNFTELGATRIRKMWMTFAPRLSGARST